MRKLALGCSLLLLTLSFVSAQSGRKTQTAPAPTPPVEETPPPPPGFSESRPDASFHRFAPVSKGVKEKGAEPGSGSQTKNKTDDDNPAPLTIETNLITIPVSVFDRNGFYIPDLKQENFQVYEDDLEQEIAYFASSEQPFTVIILLDTSPSTVFRIEEIQQAAIAFLDQLKAQDQVMVVEFDRNVHVLSKPTSNRKTLAKAIKKADIGGGTSIYDAVDFALRKELAHIPGRKAIVLFTDGVDTTSDDASFSGTLRLVEESQTPIFPIYYNTYQENKDAGVDAAGTSLEEYRIGVRYLLEIAGLTGGRVYQSESTAEGLQRAFAGIAEELRHQYNIGYYPKETGPEGQRRFLKVRVNRPNLIIRARGSYIIGSQMKTEN
ncbi:MAG: VWA domain-containing protein [Pyrinomonadaceae bacterium]